MLAFTYHKITASRQRALVAQLSRRIIGYGRSRARGSPGSFGSWDHLTWQVLHRAAQWLGGGRAYAEREVIFGYIQDVMRSTGARREPEVAATQPGAGRLSRLLSWFRLRRGRGKVTESSRLYIEHSTLHKSYGLPGAEERLVAPLGEVELELLRYLYWRRRHEDVEARFAGRVGAAELPKILDHHLRIGSVVRLKGWLLCVANDPGYWEEAYREDLPEAAGGHASKRRGSTTSTAAV